MRQSPDGAGIWNGTRFTFDSVETCDYAIVLNYPATDVEVCCPPGHVWAIVQEPPNAYFGPLHRGRRRYARVYTSREDLRGERYIHSQPALPWHVDRDYSFLRTCRAPRKEKLLSSVTSSKAVSRGHRARLRFVRQLCTEIDFDLYGRGFCYVADKWDALAPYRYSIAIENFRGRDYWTEKLSDCFLAWTMPIYCGCTNITDYFPEESMIIVDIDDPSATERIREAMANRRWQRNLGAVGQARELVLDRYQFFPFICAEIERHEGHACETRHRFRSVHLSGPPQGLKACALALRRLSRGYVPYSWRRTFAAIWHHRSSVE
jgi:hypothetical protein